MGDYSSCYKVGITQGNGYVFARNQNLIASTSSVPVNLPGQNLVSGTFLPACHNSAAPARNSQANHCFSSLLMPETH